AHRAAATEAVRCPAPPGGGVDIAGGSLQSPQAEATGAIAALPALSYELRPEETRMSFTIVEQAPARLNRSELAVPGSNAKFLEKATQSKADVIFLDLEDAVAPDDKEQARRNVVAALNDLDWTGKTV